MADFSKITDVNGNQHTVKDSTARTGAGTSFDNTGTGLNATNVQNAITELNTNLSQKVSSVNGETPDTNGNVQIDATKIDTSSGVAIKSVSGNPVTIADALQGKALGVNTTIEPIQDLHGYVNPWPAGGGKNLVNVTATSQTISGVTFTINTDNGGNVIGITVNGTTTGDVIYNLGTYTITTAGTYALSGCPSNGSTSTFYLDCRRDNSSQVIDIGRGAEFESNGQSGKRVRIIIASGVQMNNIVFYPMIRKSTDSATFEPYSNICPISGRTQVEIVNSDSEDVEQASVTVQLGQTVYGGSLNVSTGELVSTHANIASYNGETIREPWMSSMDEYVAGATPTTGAQVVYPLATPTESSVTPAQLNLLTGTNIITTNVDDLSVRYYATGQTGNVEENLSFLLDETASNGTAINTVSESIAPIETGTATQAYAVGDYLVLNNRLCKVISAIAVGETITIGTNVSRTTIADELKAIIAQLGA